MRRKLGTVVLVGWAFIWLGTGCDAQPAGKGASASSAPEGKRIESLVGMLATLSTAAGDGQVVVDVDAYGSFGYETFEIGSDGDALFDPLGSVGPSSTTWESGLYFRDPGSSTFLTTGLIGSFTETGLLPDPGFIAVDAISAKSFFTFNGLEFTLDQWVEDVFDGGNRVGSVLIQQYQIVNPGAALASFDLVRYYEGDLYLGAGAGIPDGGGHILIGKEEFVFETDLAGEPSDTTNLVGISACGGQIPVTGRYEVGEWTGFPDRIHADLPLGDVVFLDGPDPDEFVDPGMDYDVGIALANQIDLGPGENVTYVTTTLFGTLSPEVAAKGCQAIIDVDEDEDGDEGRDENGDEGPER